MAHASSRFSIRSTNEKGYYQTFFSGSEKFIDMLKESKGKEVIQRELERISGRKDFRVTGIVWQGAWR
jgi:hypothetical protein